MERPALLNSALIIPPLALALAAPGFALAAQEAVVATEPAQGSASERRFRWPDFIPVDPLPGEYRLTMTFGSIRVANAEAGKIEDVLADEIGEPEVTYQCLVGEPNRANIAYAFDVDDCIASEPSFDGDAFDISLQCSAPNSDISNIRLSGIANDQGLDMLTVMRMDDEDVGKMQLDMRIQIERVGDCE